MGNGKPPAKNIYRTNRTARRENFFATGQFFFKGTIQRVGRFMDEGSFRPGKMI
jgi:hypothetical protein